jgi:three prime repair exonuclease-1
MCDVKTLVYFDLEATGLKSSGRPRICEISCVAVNIEDVLQLGLKLTEERKLCENSFLPRIVNKLTLCVYPMAIIVPLVSDLTGLDNYNLSGQSKFTKTTADLLNSFLSCLPSPVCLVAHNGNAYDFPLLKAELEKSGAQLNPGLLCVDSLLGLRELLQKQGKTERRNPENVNYKEIKAREIYAATELVKAGMFEAEMIEGNSELLDKPFSKIHQADSEVTPIGA